MLFQIRQMTSDPFTRSHVYFFIVVGVYFYGTTVVVIWIIWKPQYNCLKNKPLLPSRCREVIWKASGYLEAVAHQASFPYSSMNPLLFAIRFSVNFEPVNDAHLRNFLPISSFDARLSPLSFW